MHNLLKYVIYTVIIVYFKKLIKYLNAEKMISVVKNDII